MSKARDLAAEINKALGVDAVRLGSDPELQVGVIPTGVLPIDVLLDGGVPRGRFMEFFGDSSTLKTYLGLTTMREAQQAGGTAAIVDTEHAFDPEWAETLGVDTESLIVMQPPTMEDAVDVTEALVRNAVDVVVWDSVAASLPMAEQEKSEKEKHQPARLAAAMSRATRKINAANESTAVIWINQTREKVGVVYGSPETTPGGRSLPFYASHRVALRKAGSLREDVKSHDGYQGKTVKETRGQKIRATLEKSRLTKPHRDVLFTFDYTTGRVDEARFMVSYGLDRGLIERRGKVYSIGGETWSGVEATVEAVRESEELQQSLRSAFLGSARPVR